MMRKGDAVMKKKYEHRTFEINTWLIRYDICTTSMGDNDIFAGDLEGFGDNDIGAGALG